MEQKIINIILKEANQVKGSCLFTGKTGLCLALMVAASKRKDKKLQSVAEEMLLEINQNQDGDNLSLDKGVIGIGLAMNFLIAEGYAEGNTDDVLYNVDAAIYRVLHNPSEKVGTEVYTGLIGFLLYWAFRIPTTQEETLKILNSASLRSTINRLDDAFPELIHKSTKDIFATSSNPYPLLFIFLKRAYDTGIYNDKILLVLKKWYRDICAHIPTCSANRLYLSVALAYITSVVDNQELKNFSSLLFNSIDWDEIYGLVDARIMDIHEGWPFYVVLLYLSRKYMSDENILFTTDSVRIRLLSRHIPLFEEYLMKDECNVTFINGLSGVLLLMEYFPDAFKYDVKLKRHANEKSNRKLKFNVNNN